MSHNPLKIDPIVRLKIAKQVTPQIFEGATPRFHLDVLNIFEKRHTLTALAIFRGAAKTTIFNKVYVATEIFLNHEPFTQIVSKDKDKAKSFLKDIKSLLMSMQSKGYSVMKGSVWSDSHIEVIVDGVHKCVVKALGAGEDPRGDTADFMRPTLIVIDDLESKLGRYNVTNRKLREKLEKWVYEDLLPGLHPKNGRCIFMGTILHKYSLLANALRDDEWHSINLPIVKSGKLMWSSRFDVEHIKSVRERYRKKGNPSGFYREYMNKPIADDKILFKDEYFKYFSHIEFEDKSEVRFIKNATSTISISIRSPKNIVFNDGTKLSLDNCTIRTTMDVASGSETGDRTAIVTVATDAEGNKYVLEIKSGYWNPFEKAVYSIETYLTYKPLFFGIEKGGMQNDFHSSIEVLQKEESVNIPVMGLAHGGINKNIRIGNMQPSFVQGKYWFNSSDPNTFVVEAQLSAFDIESDSEEDDEMDALAYHEKYNKFNSSTDEEEEDYEEALYD